MASLNSKQRNTGAMLPRISFCISPSRYEYRKPPTTMTAKRYKLPFFKLVRRREMHAASWLSLTSAVNRNMGPVSERACSDTPRTG